MRSRLAAWLVTGPLGHLVAGVVDWAELLVRWLWSRWTASGSPRASRSARRR
jgi:hypothetical protein